jgi:hypothetical protein
MSSRSKKSFESKPRAPDKDDTGGAVEQARGKKGFFERLPEVGEPVIVQCRDFQCLGFLDDAGKWRDFARSQELPEVIDWFEV